MSAEPTPVGMTSTTSTPTSLEPARDLATRPEQIRGRHAAGLRRPGARCERGVEDVDVHGEEHRPVADRCDRSLDDLADSEVAHVVHEVRGDAVLALPGELRFSRPVAAQPDLDVSACVDVAVADEPVHGRAVGVLHAEDLGAGVRVRVEVDEADGTVARGDSAHVRLRDRVVASQNDGDRARGDGLSDRALDLRVRPLSESAGTTAASPKSTTRSSASASIFASRCGPGGQLAARIARGPKRVPGRSETRSSVGAPITAMSTPASSAGSCVYGMPA